MPFKRADAAREETETKPREKAVLGGTHTILELRCHDGPPASQRQPVPGGKPGYQIQIPMKLK